MSRGPETSPLAEELLAILRARWAAPGPARRVVGLAGESGSGKSVTADSLAVAFAAVGVRALVLNQDNYFVRPPRTNHEHRLESLTHVGPHEVNLGLLSQHIDAFRTAAPHVSGPLVDYPGNRFLMQRLDFPSADLLIVEGTYVLQLDNLDARIFFQATYQDSEARRQARNRDIDAPIIQQILAIEHDIIARQAELADILVDRHFAIVRPERERAAHPA
jgi:uridine kinase